MTKRKMGAGLAYAALLGAVCVASAGGCGDSEALSPLPGTGGAGAGGGNGDVSSTTHTTTTTTSTTSTSTTSTSTTTSSAGGGGANVGGGGANSGGGGATGTGGAGGAGGGSPCLDASTYQDLFELQDTDLCVVAVRELALKFDFHVAAMTWGKYHHGPLIVTDGTNPGDVSLLRASIMDDTSMSLDTKSVTGAFPAAAYLGYQAVDLGFFNWTAISWTGPAPSTEGQILLLDGTTVATSYPANGPYAIGAVAYDANTGRLLYSGLSAINDAVGSKNGLYAADSCGMTGPTAALGTCAPGVAIDNWGGNSGPVAVDAAGNVFAVMPTFAASTTQEARGFPKASVARGAAPVLGTTLFTLDGYGSSLAAMAPVTVGGVKLDGILAFQPIDSTNDALDVVEARYSAQALAAVTPTTMLRLTVPNTELGLANDDDGNLWVAGPRGTDTTAFVVIARRPSP